MLLPVLLSLSTILQAPDPRLSKFNLNYTPVIKSYATIFRFEGRTLTVPKNGFEKLPIDCARKLLHFTIASHNNDPYFDQSITFDAAWKACQTLTRK